MGNEPSHHTEIKQNEVDHQKYPNMNAKKQDDYIVCGWIRKNATKLNINIPLEIIKICYIWYHLRHEILKWSDNY